MLVEWIRFVAAAVSVKEMCKLGVLVLLTLMEISFDFYVFFTIFSLFFCVMS